MICRRKCYGEKYIGQTIAEIHVSDTCLGSKVLRRPGAFAPGSIRLGQQQDDQNRQLNGEPCIEL